MHGRGMAHFIMKATNGHPDIELACFLRNRGFFSIEKEESFKKHEQLLATDIKAYYAHFNGKKLKEAARDGKFWY